MRSHSRLKVVPWTNTCLKKIVSFPLFGFTLFIKSRNFDCKSHWNTLKYFDKKRYGGRFEHILWKNVCFCFISIVWVHFSHKNEKFRFWRSLKYFNSLWFKNDVRFDYLLRNSVWFCLSFVIWVESWHEEFILRSKFLPVFFVLFVFVFVFFDINIETVLN